MIAPPGSVTAAPGDHLVQFYGDEGALTAAVASYLADGIVAGENVLVVATPEHEAAFGAALAAAGVDVDAARATGQYNAYDAAETLARFMVDGRPDDELFDDSVGALVTMLTDGARRLRVYGEMVALLWDEGNVSGAVSLEELWNWLGTRMEFALFCAYPSAAIGTTTDGHQKICDHHTAVVPDPPPVPANDVSVSRWFEPTAFAVPVSRHFVDDTLSQWRADHLVDSARVVVTELVTNAVKHGRTGFRLTVTRDADVIRVAVGDRSGELPERSPIDNAKSTTGRGLTLVAGVSCRWGTTVEGDGKTVWAELDVAQ